MLVFDEQRNRRCILTVNLGLAANIFLAVIKTGTGIFGHSPALLADGINSSSDVAYTVVVAVFMRKARKPADEQHPYGHSQMESIASLVVGSFVITTAIALLWTAINQVFELLIGEITVQGAAPITFWIAMLTVLLKVGLAIYTRRVGEETHNPAVLALSHDHRNDVLSAGGAAFGIFMGFLGYTWVDPLAGALVALLVLRTGVEIIRQSSAELMDAVPSKTLAKRIQSLLIDVPGVKTVEEVHAHRFGPYLVINLIIGVDGMLSVEQGDCIASHVEEVIIQKIDLVRQVYVHYHPARRELFRVGDPRELPVYRCDLE